jgi:serine/threonine protein kinase
VSDLGSSLTTNSLTLIFAYNLHPPPEHCLQLHAFHSTPDTCFLLLDLCSDGDLLHGNWLSGNLSGARSHGGQGGDDGGVTEAKVALVILHVARALEHCHAKDIVHRDVKPENILVGRSRGSRSGRPASHLQSGVWACVCGRVCVCVCAFYTHTYMQWSGRRKCSVCE